MNNYNNILSNNVDNLLKEKGYKREWLSEQLHISLPTLSRYLNGNPTLNTITKIANALQVDVARLFRKEYFDIVGIVKVDGNVYDIQDFESLKQVYEKAQNNIGGILNETIYNIKMKRLQLNTLQPNSPI